jgi:hypothetical protein
MRSRAQKAVTRAALPAALGLSGALWGCALIARQGTIAYLAVTSGSKDVVIQMHKSFIESYRNRVTISARMTIDQVMPRPIPPALDGDLHFAGRAPLIGLPVVGEITNAASHKEAMDIAHQAGGSGRAVNVTGVWRVWPEHAGGTPEVQGEPLPEYKMSNPNHVFEIHPVTRIENVETLDAFTPVAGFKPGDAGRTFGIYEKATCTLEDRRETIAITTQPGLYNDVEFLMQLADAPQQEVADGRFVFASAMDLKGKVLVPRLRIVFAKGTPPEIAVRDLKPGDKLHVYGIPRLSFEEIARRVGESKNNPAILSASLPYEIIIIGVFAK